MKVNKKEILDNICYTELVYGRINKKLAKNFSKAQIEKYMLELVEQTPENLFCKKGKNFYVTNTEHGIRLTINSNSFRIITVNRVRAL